MRARELGGSPLSFLHPEKRLHSKYILERQTLDLPTQHIGMVSKILVLAALSKKAEETTCPHRHLHIGIESKSCHYYQSDWILNLVCRKPRKVAICAIANKMCRIAWAVAATENGRYDRTKTSLVSVLMKSPEQIEQQKAAKAQAAAKAA